MRSPFPGMDPYLEHPAFWREFHSKYLNTLHERLLSLLPPQYDASLEEHMRVVERPTGEAAQRRARYPDVAVTRRDEEGGLAVADSPLVGTIEPVAVPATESVELRDRWIEVRHRPDNTLVTAIELLSPDNKRGVGFGEYQRKRYQFLNSQVHLLEIDLLLGGRRPVFGVLPPKDYFAFVTRADVPPSTRQTLAYPWPLSDPLPAVPVPLRAPDADVGLDLAEAFAATYERGRYLRRLPYEEPLAAEAPESQRAWLADRLKIASGK